MRKMLLTCAAALVVVAPAQAGGAHDRGLTISGMIVRASATAVSVADRDLVLTCAVPERLASTAAAFKAGDTVRMECVRYRGRRAQLLKLERLGERVKRVEKPAQKPLAAKPPKG
jgi:hypothetical protein